MKTKHLVLLTFATTSLVLSACQPSPSKRQGQKVRVTGKTRTTQKFNFEDNAEARQKRNEAIEKAGETLAKNETSTEETVDMTNALCDAGSESTCNAIRVSVLETGKLDGIDRREASNAGKAHIVTTNETTVTDKKVEVKIEFKNLKNKNEKLLIVASETAETTYSAKLRKLDLSNVEFQILPKNSSAKEVSDIKVIAKEFEGKVLVLAPTAPAAASLISKLALPGSKVSTLVAPKTMEARVIVEQVLSLIGTVIPVNFVTPHATSLVDVKSLSVRLDDKLLTLATDYGTDVRGTGTFRVFLIQRSLLNADSKLELTYKLN